MILSIELFHRGGVRPCRPGWPVYADILYNLIHFVQVAKLVTNDRLAWTLLAEACVLRAEKLVTEKLGREEYIDEENKVDEKLKELTSESDELLRSMSA